MFVLLSALTLKSTSINRMYSSAPSSCIKTLYTDTFDQAKDTHFTIRHTYCTKGLHCSGIPTNSMVTTECIYYEYSNHLQTQFCQSRISSIHSFLFVTSFAKYSIWFYVPTVFNLYAYSLHTKRSSFAGGASTSHILRSTTRIMFPQY